MKHQTGLYLGDAIANYGFDNGHPFGPKRHNCFKEELLRKGLNQQLNLLTPVMIQNEKLHLFHTEEYIQKVQDFSLFGTGYLDAGDTPSFIGMFEAAGHVAGSVLDAIDRIMSGQYRQVFSPIAGLHHARRDTAAGFCVFNDCGIAIEYLRAQYGLKRVAYVDIDAHHGDGVFYSFEDDKDFLFADIHQDGNTLYPGTGDAEETGVGSAMNTKLNLPVAPYSNDHTFKEIWPKVERYLRNGKPEFILFQCGADSIEGDPITQMALSPESHILATQRLMNIADQFCNGRLLVMGGGGYNHSNIAAGWTAVVDTMVNN